MKATNSRTGSATSASGSHGWAHYPWLLGLLVSPLLFGSVRPEGQAVVALLFALSILFSFEQLGDVPTRLFPPWLRALLFFLLLLPMIPLPGALVSLLSPASAALGHTFPVNAGATGSWLPLTLSTAGTVQRLWELALIITCFSLARHFACREGFARCFVWFIAIALLLLAASDVYYRADGRRALLGIWKLNWGVGAGTFANRNHFANWVYVAVVFLSGWILRNLRPLRGARPGAASPNHLFRVDAAVLVLVLFFALGMAVACGSRGGLIAFLAGLLVWVIILAQRSHSRTRWLSSGLFVLGVVAVVLFAGDLVFNRLADVRGDLAGRYPKMEIWRQSFAVFMKFPLFGTGWGTFVTAFNHFKTMGGDSTFWHVENDYLQLLVETGIVGLLVFGFLLYRLGSLSCRFAWSLASKMAEPELVFGAVAAVTVFAVHAVIEFVFQVTATALLAAALCGFIIGCRDYQQRPAAVPPASRSRIFLNLAWALALGVVAILQGLAYLHWNEATNGAGRNSPEVAARELHQSLSLWPMAVERQIALTRVEVKRFANFERTEQLHDASLVRAGLNHALEYDPYNWQLRLERAWLDIAYSTNAVAAVEEAREVVRLSPLQAQIPLRFARHFLRWNPAAAWDFLLLAAGDATVPRNEVLALTWQMKHSTAALWEVTPDTTAGLSALGEFALNHNLPDLAVEAYQRLKDRVNPLSLAEKFLAVKRPDLALALLPTNPDNDRERLLLARASLQAGDFPQAIRHAEGAWMNDPRSSVFTRVSAPNGALNDLHAAWLKSPKDVTIALKYANGIYQLLPQDRDLSLLRQLADNFPSELQLRWFVYRTELDRHNFQPAAEAAVDLAQRVLTSK